MTGNSFKSVATGIIHASHVGRLDNRLSQRVLRARFGGRRKAQQFVFIDRVAGHHQVYNLRLSNRQGTRLVKHDCIQVGRAFQRLGGWYQ